MEPFQVLLQFLKKLKITKNKCIKQSFKNILDYNKIKIIYHLFNFTINNNFVGKNWQRLILTN